MPVFQAQVLVSGRVQGVFFRESTRRRAESLGLSGFVRNLPDGRVEACFSGEESAVRSAVDFVREGPDGARVDAVKLVMDWAEESSEGSPEPGFQIR